MANVRTLFSTSAIAIGGVGFGTALLGYFVAHGTTIFAYPLVMFITASIIYLVFRKKPSSSSDFSPDVGRKLDGVVFALITILAYLGYTSTSSIPDVYFGLYLVAAILVVANILTQPSLFCALEVLLLAINFRGTVWYITPVFGKDARTHSAIIGYIMRTGELIPTSITYYRFYPISHLGAAEIGLIGGLEPKRAFFLFAGLSAACSIVVSYVFIRRLLAVETDWQRPALLGMVIMAFSAFHIGHTAKLWAQTVAISLIPFVLYLSVSRDRRRYLLAVFFFVALNITHNLAPALIIMLLTLYLIVDTLSDWFVTSVQGYESRHQAYPILSGASWKIITSIALFTILTIQYYMVASYFKLQFLRVVRIFLFARGVEAEISDPVSQGLPMTDVLSANIYLQQVPLLFSASTLLVILFFIVLGGYLYLEQLPTGTSNQPMMNWVVMSGLSSVVILLLFFFGQQVSHVVRGMHILSIIVAPVVGYTFYRFYEQVPSFTSAVFVIILTIFVFLALISPTASIVERTETSAFTPTLDSSELAGIDFIYEQNVTAYSDSYAASSDHSLDFGLRHPAGEPVGSHDDPLHSYLSVKSGEVGFQSYASEHPDTAFLYRKYIGAYLGISEPDYFDRIYDSGDTTVIYPS